MNGNRSAVSTCCSAETSVAWSIPRASATALVDCGLFGLPFVFLPVGLAEAFLKRYGEFDWTAVGSLKRVRSCSLKPPGEVQEIVCHSPEEFDAILKRFMD